MGYTTVEPEKFNQEREQRTSLSTQLYEPGWIGLLIPEAGDLDGEEGVPGAAREMFWAAGYPRIQDRT